VNQTDLFKVIEDKTRSILKDSIQVDPIIRKRIIIESPIPIYGYKGEIVSWFVSLTVEDKIIGFLQFDSMLSYMRYSSFQRKPNSIEECPESKSWLDIKYIMNRAKKMASAEDTLEKPILSFDESLARIAWLVKAVNKNGAIKRIFVAGDYVYMAN
jgi:hypothetical protein